MSDLVGQTIDHYRIDRLLGHGGMGIIYQATDLELQRPVAMKVMHEHLARHEQFRERFAQEARAASSLEHHPNIVRVLDFSPTRLYIVMELITGGSLRDYLNRMQAGLEYREAIQLVREIADALDYAHRRGMIHRDVKPENILLKPVTARLNHLTFQAMLTDFGLAKLTESIGFTLTGRPLGTFPYMSPEQFQAEGVDGRTDIYALGIVLYELTVGRLPFRPQQLMEAFRMHTQEPVPLPGSIRPNFPRLLEKVILKCLAKRPDERYQTAKELANVLGRLQLDLENGHATDPRPEAEQTDIGTEPVPFTLSQVAAPETALERDSIVIYSQGQPPRIVPISKPVMLIGRESGKDIVLADRLVSREHAQVERKADGTYWIKDLGSTNSSVLGDARLEANTPEEWMYGQTVRIGSFALRLQPGSVPQVNVTEPQQRVPSPIMATEPQNSAAYALSQIPFTEPQNGEQQPSFRLTGVNIQAPNQPIMVVMSPANVKVNPGETAEVRVEVSNRGFSADDLMLEVRGVPGDWAEIAAPALQVTPGASIVTTIAFTPPRQWTSRAGRHTYTLRVHSAAQQMEVAKLTGVLHVAAFQNFTASLHPRRIYERGVTTLTIANEGNAAADFVLQARDRENGLYFDLESTHVSVEPGQSETVRLEVAPRPSALVHGAKLMPFEVRVKAADGESRAAPGELLAVANLAGQQPVGAVVPVQPELAPVPPPDVIPAPIVVPSLQSTERERGGCLTLWLLLHSAFALLLIPTIVVETFVVGFLLSLNAESSGIFVLLLGLSWLLALVYGVTLIYAWNWRAWAVYLLMFLSFFLIPVGPFLTLVWWLLVRNKRSMFS